MASEEDAGLVEQNVLEGLLIITNYAHLLEHILCSWVSVCLVFKYTKTFEKTELKIRRLRQNLVRHVSISSSGTYHHNVRLVPQAWPCRRCLPAQSFCCLIWEILKRLWLQIFLQKNYCKLGSLQKSTAISLSFRSFSRKVSAYFSLKPPLCAFALEMESWQYPK